MATVSLFYRDGDNYKCFWDHEIPDETMRKLPQPDEDGMHTLEQLGLEPDDVPLIAEYGFDSTSDHNFVTVQGVKYDSDK